MIYRGRRNKSIQIEATQWFKLGDHPAITELLDQPATPQPDCGEPGNAHGKLVTGGGHYGVCPGSYIVTFADGSFGWVPKTRFEKDFAPIPWWQFWRK